MLCNPTLHEYRLLPEPKNSRNYSLMAKEFGYDARSKDYKFVKLFHHPEHNAEVYTLFKYWFLETRKNESRISRLWHGYGRMSIWSSVCRTTYFISSKSQIMEWSIAERNDSVSLFSSVRERENSDPMLSIEIWVMSDYRSGLRRIGGS